MSERLAREGADDSHDEGGSPQPGNPASAAVPPYPADQVRPEQSRDLPSSGDLRSAQGRPPGAYWEPGHDGPPGTDWEPAAGQQLWDPGQAHPPRARRVTGWRLVTLVLATAVTAALAGGLLGGYIEYRASSAGTDPGYSLGAVPPALTNRPPDSIAGIAARVLPSVVMIKVNGAQGTGSGFVIRGGYIVTDNHVITLDGQVRHAALEIVLDGGRMVQARIIGTDPYSDIAVIKPAVAIQLPALQLGNSGSVRVGDPVVAFGSPLGLAGTVTSGIVSAVGRPVQPGSSAGVTSAPQVFFDAIQTDAPINPGNSGGPLVDGQAQVIGIDAAIDTLGSNPITGGQGGSIGLGFAIPINQARLIATQLIRTGRAAHAVIGALIKSNFGGAGAQITPTGPRGAASVIPGGPAARAGLRPGDVIIGFGGQRIDSPGSLLDAIRSLQPGARVAVRYTRNGISHSVSLTLGAAES
jgi:putative serine protease PepD